MNTKVKIDKNIPLPKKYIYPFVDMKVGDSFFINKKRTTVYYAVKYYVNRKGYGKKFKLKSVENGTRCWRIK